MNPETEQDYRWLITSDAAKYLDESLTAIRDRINILTIVKRLRKDISPSRAALVTELAQVRLRAKNKFALAEQMFFTRKGYEQSTGELIAHYKSLAFDDIPLVADICCGIGGDLLGIGSRNGNGDSVGFDRDFLCALFAEKNIEANMIPNVTIERRDFADIPVEEFGAIHVDPDRRQRGGRTIKGEFFEPTLDQVFELVQRNGHCSVKVAPATPAPRWLNKSCWTEWIGDQRECKQQVIWTGDLAKHPATRTATQIFSDGSSEHYSNDPDEPPPTAEISPRIKDFLYEPHPSVIAAGLVDNLAVDYGLLKISKQVSYLTSPDCVRVPMTRLYEVDEVLPFSIRHVGTRLRQMEVGTLDIKTRNVRSSEVEHFAKMKLIGDQHAILVLTRHRDKRVALIAHRIEPDDV